MMKTGFRKNMMSLVGCGILIFGVLFFVMGYKGSKGRVF